MRNNCSELNKWFLTVFVNSDNSNAQGECQIWAIMDGVRRLGKRLSYFWNYRGSRKNHDCVRGRKIPEWSAYFTYQNRVGWDSALKICARCMATILYFTGLAYMPFYMNTRWDIGSQKP
jgi:hypothetical protein